MKRIIIILLFVCAANLLSIENNQRKLEKVNAEDIELELNEQELNDFEITGSEKIKETILDRYQSQIEHKIHVEIPIEKLSDSYILIDKINHMEPNEIGFDIESVLNNPEKENGIIYSIPESKANLKTYTDYNSINIINPIILISILVFIAIITFLTYTLIKKDKTGKSHN